MKSIRRAQGRPQPPAEPNTIIRNFVRRLADLPDARKPQATAPEPNKPITEKP